jgi:hypothetical protein
MSRKNTEQSKEQDKQFKEHEAEVLRLSHKLIDACKQAESKNPFVALNALHTTSRNLLRLVFGEEADSIYARHIAAAREELRPIFDAVLVERGGHKHGGGDLSSCPLCNPALAN